MSQRPIAEYALLSDRHSAALVSVDGSVDWLCFPRFDSPSVFGALLDDEAGHWLIRPATPASVSRTYQDESMVLRTTFSTGAGELVLTDALAIGSDTNVHRLGAGAPHVLVRDVECVAGTVDVVVEFRPRPEYGLVVPDLAVADGGIVAHGGSANLALSCPIELSIADGLASGTTTLQAGQRLRLALQWSELDSRMWTDQEIGAALTQTYTAWLNWSEAHQNYDGPWRDLVRHSGRVLQALSYQPTGAIVAAATTSLPELVGGGRNWDYRYTWIRDAALTMDALWVAACPDEAGEFFGFITSTAATHEPGRRLQIMYGIGGEHDLSERTLDHLSGWRGSRPVRVGNGAWAQTQHDVYGELLATASRFADQLNAQDQAQRDFLIGLADTAAQLWQQPDHGIWEIRGEPRHFLHSKLMCWVALDRAIALAGQLDATDRREGWAATREAIRTAILGQGWSDSAGAYAQSFGSDELDASVLMLPIAGFITADDPRMLATIDAIAEQLTDPSGLVYRYRTDTGVDGLHGGEGTFLLCTFWLAHALTLSGQHQRARAAFESAAAYANDVGLLAEQADPANGELLGNFPQAFSHIGLINAAYAIAESR